MTEIIDLPPGYIPAGDMLRAMYSRGVTDSEVARLTGVNQSTITRLRQGTQKKASADLYFRICAVYRSRFPEDTAGASHE